MSRSKKTLIAALVLFIIAVAGGVAAFAALDFDIYALDTHTYTHQEITMENAVFNDFKDEEGNVEITSIEVDIGAWNIEVKAGEKFNLDYYSTEDTQEAEITFLDGKLAINIENKFKFNLKNIGGFSNIKQFKYKYVLTVPNVSELILKMSNAHVDMKDVEFGKFIFDGTNADIDLSNVKVDDFQVKSTNLTIDVDNSTFKTSSIRGTNSDVEMSSCTIEDAIFSGTNSDVELTSCTIDKADFSGTNFDLDINMSNFNKVKVVSTNFDGKISSSIISEELDVSGTNATLKTDSKITCPVIKLDATNGTFILSIDASLADYKSITCTGTNKSMKINDEKRGDYTGVGENTINCHGTNVTLRVNFND